MGAVGGFGKNFPEVRRCWERVRPMGRGPWPRTLSLGCDGLKRPRPLCRIATTVNLTYVGLGQPYLNQPQFTKC